MSFTATWSVLATEEDDVGGEMVVRTSDDIDNMVRALAQPGATAAMVQHQERPKVQDEDLGEIPDHDMTVGVWQGFGYLSFADLDHEFMHLEGAPDSPSFAGDYAEYPAGSGVSLDLLRTALIEFLETGRRPATVDWRTNS